MTVGDSTRARPDAKIGRDTILSDYYALFSGEPSVSDRIQLALRNRVSIAAARPKVAAGQAKEEARKRRNITSWL